jgi:DNA-3-methyladenine glycosylase II
LTRTSVREASEYLAGRDRDLSRILSLHGPPPLWARSPGFTSLLRIILEQQVSLASAQATLSRLVEGVQPFTPERFLDLGVARLRAMGVTRQKAGYCIHLACAIREGGLDLKGIARMGDATATAALTRIKGIGPWTAEIYLLMVLRRPDVWPSGDLALARTVRRIKRLRGQPSTHRMNEIAEAWRPYRAVAARMLWQHYLAGFRGPGARAGMRRVQ